MKREPDLGKGKKPVFPDGTAEGAEQRLRPITCLTVRVTSFLWTFLPPQPTSPNQSTVLAAESSEPLCREVFMAT